MPNEPTGSFPTPSEVKLTDEIAPNLSTPVEPAPVIPVPATMPKSVSKPFPAVTSILLLTSIGAIAATYFFYQQTRSLSTQLDQITTTLKQQSISQNQAAITPTETAMATPSGQSPLGGAPTPTSSLNLGTGPVWGTIGDVMAAAQKQYPQAQLILVKVDNATGTSQTIKYWFRQNTTDRKYLYLLKEVGKDLILVDQNVSVFETKPLSSLNALVTDNQLGLDLDEATTIAAAACPTTFDCVNTPISAQYVKTGSVLWQIKYQPVNNSTPFVVQVDAATKKIIFKSL